MTLRKEAGVFGVAGEDGVFHTMLFVKLIVVVVIAAAAVAAYCLVEV
jgi:hypothetical protein